jgi:MFS family permease
MMEPSSSQEDSIDGHAGKGRKVAGTAEVRSESAPELAAGHAPGYTAFVVGTGSWFGAWGMQQVLFSWIVVGELRASSEWVGIAQTSTMLPATLLLLAGGALADRVDPRRLLIAMHALAVVPVLLLSVASASGDLDLAILIAYGLTIGTIQAFSMPARDTLLSRVAGADMMRAVTGMTAIQFGSQACGTLLAALARVVGSAPMLVVQAATLLIGCFASRAIPASEPRPAAPTPHIRDLVRGVFLMVRTPELRSPAIMVVAVGVLFVGPYMVVFPLMVRDYYAAGIDALSVVFMLFPLGTITGSLVLRRRGIRRKGRAALLALASGAIIEGVVGIGVPFGVLIGLILAWGLSGAVFINCSRTLYQEAAPADGRGSVLAVYQLGFMGGAPLGAMLSGFAIGALGLHGTLQLASAIMLSLAAGMAVFTSTRTME